MDINAKTVSFNTNSFGLFALLSSPPEINNQNLNSSSGSSGFINLIRPLLKPIEIPKKVSSDISDFNNDGFTDVIDLSILLYWWGKTGSDVENYDLNSDGAIDIVDISILFYHWTV